MSVLTRADVGVAEREPDLGRQWCSGHGQRYFRSVMICRSGISRAALSGM